MDLLERVKLLCKQQGISLNKLEERLEFPRGYMYTWKKKVPGVDRLQKVADYFQVSTDYLLGRTDNPKLSHADEIDIQKTVDEMIQGLSNKNGLSFMKIKNGGEDVNIDEAELLKSSLEVVARESLILSRQRAKKNNE